GMGYDPSLERKIGITLIATGFEQKDPVAALHKESFPAKPMEKPEPAKIVMTLGIDGEEKKMYNQTNLPFEEKKKDEYAPTLSEPLAEEIKIVAPIIVNEIKEEENLKFELQLPQVIAEVKIPEAQSQPKEEEVIEEMPSILSMLYEEKMEAPKAVPSAFLNKPSSIYAQQNEKPAPKIIKEEIKKDEPKKEPQKPLFEEEMMEFDLVIKEEVIAPKQTAAAVFNLPANDEEEEQKRRADERMHKLRNLSYNMNTLDSGGEYENVPAYVRRNLELFGNNKLTTVEDFYSKVAVKKDENNQTHISTINTFLDGKKPD
ncbi:MAG: cell division protein FtsZ, partial [Parafilimonas sp.]